MLLVPYTAVRGGGAVFVPGSPQWGERRWSVPLRKGNVI